MARIVRVIAAAVIAAASAGCGGRALRPPAVSVAAAPDVRAAALARPGAPVVRIGLAVGLDSLWVGSDAAWRVALRGKARRPNLNAAGARWLFRSATDGVGVVDDRGRYRGAFPETLLFYPDERGFIEVFGRAYRDTLEVFRGEGGLTVVNIVAIEDYLRGVVAQEIGGSSPEHIEAVKAQAVAARTYTLSYIGRWKDLGFDLYGDERDQVYAGVTGERSWSDLAIDATSGIVAMHDGSPIRTNYHSTCGGHTAGNDEVWDQKPLPFLRAREDRDGGGDFCRDSPHYRWEETLTADAFWAGVRAFKFGDGAAIKGETLREVKVRKRSESGRVRELLVRTSKRSVVVYGDAIRWAVRRPANGNPALRSTCFDVRVEKGRGGITKVILRGRGFGHGVGMCQMGALGMSREGYDYEKILGHYYRGIELRRLY